MLLESNTTAINTYGLAIRYLPVVSAVIALITILVSYRLAVSEGHVDPYPGTDITHCMIKYPEYIVGRIGLIAGACLILVNWFFITWYLQEWSAASVQYLRSTTATVNVPGRSIVLVGSISSILLCLSTATMSDGGDMNMNLHVFGASGFFITCIYNLLRVTVVVQKLYAVLPGFMSSTSYKAKTIVQWLMVLLAVLAILSKIPPFSKQFPKDFGNILEWNATGVVMLGLGSYTLDFKYFEVYFAKKKQQAMTQ